MNSRRPLHIDLNGLYQPFLASGLKSLEDLVPRFDEVHREVMALKNTGNLPFSQLPDNLAILDQVLESVKAYKDVQNVVVFGIGGSALGTSSVYTALKGPYANLHGDSSSPRLFVVDHIETSSVSELARVIRGQKTLFVVISKSGNTSETLAQYLYAKRYFDINSETLFVITDPHNGFLHDLVQKEGLPHLTIPTGVGGRFSVLSAVGLFPLKLCGVEIGELLEGAQAMEKRCREAVFAQNPAGLLALSLFETFKNKNVSQISMMPYSERLKLFSDWFAQLWAESLGKNHIDGTAADLCGQTALKATGVTDQHSQLQLYLEGPKDKVVCVVGVDNQAGLGGLCEEPQGDERVDFLVGKSLDELMHAERVATEATLTENACPNFNLSLIEINEYQLGQLYQLWMNVIPYMGVLMNINAFDQPAVERIKKFTFGLMGRQGFEDFAAKLKGQGRDSKLVF